MRKLLSVSLLGLAVVAVSGLIPTEAEAGRCGRLARAFGRCHSTSTFIVSRGVVPTDPSVTEPGAAALFALGAGLIATRSRRRAAN